MAGNKKKLLSESQVRQFMKLANLEPLTPGFVTGLTESAPVEEGFKDWVDSKLRGDVSMGGKQLGPTHGQKMADQDTIAQGRAAKFIGDEAPEGLSGALDRKAAGWKPKGKTHRAASDLEESHGRGQDEGSAGYGHPDPRQRPAGSRLREQDEDDLEMDVELDDLDGDIELDDEFEVEDDLDVEGPPEGGREVSVDDFLAALEIALEDVLGEEVEVSEDEEEELEAEDLEGEEVDLDLEDEEMLDEDKAYTAKREKPGADKRKGAEKRGAEGTLAKTKGHGRVDYVNEDEAYSSKREKPGADKRKGAEKRGAEATKLKRDEPGGRGHKKGDDAYVNEGDVLERLAHVVATRLTEKRQGADDREDEHLGAEDGKEADKKQSFKDRRKEMRGERRAKGESGDPVPTQEALDVDGLVERITRQVAARMVQEKLNSKKAK